jgi:hypothetical protein
MKKNILLSSIVLLFLGCEIGDINEVEEDKNNSSDSSTFYVSPLGDNDADGSSSTPW